MQSYQALSEFTLLNEIISEFNQPIVVIEVLL